MNYSRITPRPKSAKQDPEKVKRYLGFYACLRESLFPIWFFDETGVVAGFKPKKIIALKGSKPYFPFTSEHIRENVLGAVNPKTGQIETLLMPYSNTETFNIIWEDVILIILPFCRR